MHTKGLSCGLILFPCTRYIRSYFDLLGCEHDSVPIKIPIIYRIVYMRISMVQYTSTSRPTCCEGYSLNTDKNGCLRKLLAII